MAIEASSSNGVARRIRLGMVGGGQGAFIGAVHRIAARMDDRYELVAGALSANPERARASAAELHIAPDRAYSDYRAMGACKWLGVTMATASMPSGRFASACAMVR